MTKSKKNTKFLKGGLVCNTRQQLPSQILIQMTGDKYYLLSSLKDAHQTVMTHCNLLLQVSNYKNVNNLWDRGYYEINDKRNKLEKKKYSDVFSEKEGVPNSYADDVLFKLSVLYLFYPLNDILESSKSLPKPIIVNDTHQQKGQEGGSDASFRIIDSDPRRIIISVIIPGLQDEPNFNKGRFILKIARTKGYSDAYADEANIYNNLTELTKSDQTNNNNIVKFFGSGKMIKKNPISIISNYPINLNELSYIDEKNNYTYLLLENTYEYKDFEIYIKELLEENTSSPIATIFNSIKTIMNTLQTFNKNYNFFHGDFHAGNIKVKEGSSPNLHVKLFDFDFSAILDGDKPYITKNVKLYGLQYNNEPIFNENSIVLSENIKLDILKYFCFLFDYFRLWFNVMLVIIRYDKDMIQINVPAIQVSESPEPAFHEWLSAQLSNSSNALIDWNSQFRGNSFYNNIYCRIVKPCAISSHNSTPNTPQITFEEQLKKLKEMSKHSSDLSSNFSSVIVGGARNGKNSKKYKRLGVYKIKNPSDNSIQYSRVVWQLNKRYYLRDKSHNYIPIYKKLILF